MNAGLNIVRSHTYRYTIYRYYLYLMLDNPLYVDVCSLSGLRTDNLYTIHHIIYLTNSNVYTV